MGWVIALAVLVLLGCLPLGIRCVYDGGGFNADLFVWFLKKKVTLDRQKEKKKLNKSVAVDSAVSKEPSEKSGGQLKDFLPILETAVEFLGALRRKIRVKRLEFLLDMAGEDPCDLALNYGRAWAAAGNIIPQLERLFVIKKRDVQVRCDFTASETTLYLRVDVSITLGRLLWLLTRYGIRACIEYFKILNKRKGGAIL